MLLNMSRLFIAFVEITFLILGAGKSWFINNLDNLIIYVSMFKDTSFE
jgi:hypothetical protein